jgi:LPS-assembly lipoprotein
MTRPIGFRPHRLLAAVALLSAAGLGASGCGFKPLYGDSGAVGAPGVQSSLQQVAIAPIQTRSGQPGGGAGYSLTIRLAIQKQELGIRRDETATRANLIMTAIYRLTEQSSGATVFQALSRSVTSYNILDNEFSTVMAERDARSRGAEQLADDITTRVALYFNRTKRPVAGK